MNNLTTFTFLKHLFKWRILLYAATLCIFPSCSKLQGTVAPNATINVRTTTSDSYQPDICTSYWKYKVTQGETSDTATITMNGLSTTYNNRTYLNASVNYRSHRFPDATTYFWNDNHVYNNLNISSTDTLEQYYYNDTTSLNKAWIAKANATGYVDHKSARYAGSLVEQNINLTVQGITYTGVNHSKIYLQYFIGNTYVDEKIIDVFMVKGIGPIEMFIQDGSDNILYKEELIGYSII